jgi:hypothetical protein
MKMKEKKRIINESNFFVSFEINNLNDILSPINLDMFTVYYDRTCKLGYSGSYSPSIQANNSSNYQYYLNNDYKLNEMKKINITKYLPKI